MQINMSPYYGLPDFSGLPTSKDTAPLDLVSIADLLRNAFVYPPHSSYQDVKLVTFGFSPGHDMTRDPRFRFKFRNAGEVPEAANVEQDWVRGYHRRLCDAVNETTSGISAPWQLQSGGKDSTSLAIALAEARPETVCLTYRGGPEEDEAASATHVARTLGLRHVLLECDPGRAYDRYLAAVHNMPLLTADFALLSYFDLATEIKNNGGDGLVDGLGPDSYFGTPVSSQQRWLSRLSRQWPLPPRLTELPFVDRSFAMCYLLSTLKMEPIERVFPGTRFNDEEVDALFGQPISRRSRQRLDVYREEIGSATSDWEWRDMSHSIAGSAGSFAKGLYTAHALGLNPAYPYCDHRLREWVHYEVPRSEKINQDTHTNKILMRKHIATHFESLPYVQNKGSFRFNVRALADARFDQVHAFAQQTSDLLPGAPAWLERNRRRFTTKYHASRFYLLAVVLPWLVSRRASWPGEMNAKAA